jgi:putative ABC transport system permease protein
VEVDAVMFGRNIKPISFLYSGLLTVGFSMIVNLFMHQKLKKIDMVESLNDRASHSRYFSDELDAQFFC